jgi:hypothetical protein
MKLTLDNGEEIICTPDHKFPVYGKGFVRADQLIENESMMPLYRKKENISKFKKLDYEQFFDNETKEWVYTHKLVANFLRDDVVNHYTYEMNNNDYHVRHHIDFNRYNNDPSNLCFMSWSDHKKLHSDFGFSEESQKLGTLAAKARLQYIKENDPEQYEIICNEVSLRMKLYWENMSENDYISFVYKMSESTKDYISNFSIEEREVRDNQSIKNFLIGSKIVTEKRKNDPEYNLWFSEQQSKGWTDELRSERSKWASSFNKEIKWGKNKERSLKNHRDKQKIVYTHEMLLFVIDCIKDKTTHQVKVGDVADMINKNLDLVEKLQELNKDKSVPNWKPEYGFTANMIKKMPMEFGYANWIDFRKKEGTHNHRIVKIEYLDDEIEVGTLTIDNEEKYHNYHTFALSCGIFTKNSNLGEIDDIIYFQKRLYKALNIPVSRLEPEASIQLGGRQSEISRDELKFGKFVSKIRTRFNLLLLDLLKTELITTKVITAKEWDIINQLVEFRYSQDMYLEEQKRQDLLMGKIEVADSMKEYVGKYFSNDYVMREIFGLSEEEIDSQNKLIASEKSDPRFKQEDNF